MGFLYTVEKQVPSQKRLRKFTAQCFAFGFRGISSAALMFIIGLTFLASCASPEPVDLSGTWKTLEESDPAIVLELKPDQTYVRTVTLTGGLVLQEAGKYSVSGNEISFTNIVEGVKGKTMSEVSGTMKVKYEFRGTLLVLYPGSSKEQKFTMIR